jgi:uncharacterized protein with PIN domain
MEGTIMSIAGHILFLNVMANAMDALADKMDDDVCPHCGTPLSKATFHRGASESISEPGYDDWLECGGCGKALEDL